MWATAVTGVTSSLLIRLIIDCAVCKLLLFPGTVSTPLIKFVFDSAGCESLCPWCCLGLLANWVLGSTECELLLPDTISSPSTKPALAITVGKLLLTLHACWSSSLSSLQDVCGSFLCTSSSLLTKLPPGFAGCESLLSLVSFQPHQPSLSWLYRRSVIVNLHTVSSSPTNMALDTAECEWLLLIVPFQGY